jgi:hypothetical protein
MIKTIYTLATMLFLAIATGCGGTASNDDVLITSGSSDSKLQTLGENKKDLNEVLIEERWTKITANLDKFYQFSVDNSDKEYKIKLTFKDGKVNAIADCQKLTANYNINNNNISFRSITYKPAIDLAFCQESEDADKAVYEFFLRDFKAITLEDDKVEFIDIDSDAKITLSH